MMMLMDKKKKMMEGLIASAMGDGKEKIEATQEYPEELRLVALDLKKSLQGDDASKIISAFKAMIDLCCDDEKEEKSLEIEIK